MLKSKHQQTCQKEQTKIAVLEREISKLKQEIETCESLGEWERIPKKDLKCFGSDYVKCLDAYIRPDGVWVLDDYIPRGPPDQDCIDFPQSSEQLCNECAGGNIIIIKKKRID